MKLITDINFYPNETILRMEDGKKLPFIPTYPDGTKMTLEELRETLFQVSQNELYLKECEDE